MSPAWEPPCPGSGALLFPAGPGDQLAGPGELGRQRQGGPDAADGGWLGGRAYRVIPDAAQSLASSSKAVGKPIAMPRSAERALCTSSKVAALASSAKRPTHRTAARSK